jgi:O-acetyl-ADP-ribose deacetylase (regulator of RNase III)
MNVEVVAGSVLDSSAQTLVNTVNCVGVMGKGIALQFRKRFPDMYEDYVARCEQGEVRLGVPYLFNPRDEQLNLFGSDRRPWVLNFPTKRHWRARSRLEDIVEGLRYLEQHYAEWGIQSLAVPPLGCGNGRLEWKEVGPILHSYFGRFDIPVTVYVPEGTAAQPIDSAAHH